MPRSSGTRTVLAVLAAVVLVGASVAAIVIVVTRPGGEPAGCAVLAGDTVHRLDPEQAANAATIAGVAHRRRLPARAVVIAYAAALQESEIRNLDYGDRDSVGIFQQRPSQGWGSADRLQDPVYATGRFFAALTRVPGYTELAVHVAAQRVQRSADGSLYAQHEPFARALAAAFTGLRPQAVHCWDGDTPAGAGAGTDAERGPDLAGALRELRRTFGPLPASRGEVRVRGPRQGAAVAVWAVAHAPRYRIRTVAHDGHRWTAAAGRQGWRPDGEVFGQVIRLG